MICLRKTCADKKVLLLEQTQVCAASLSKICAEEDGKSVDPVFRADARYAGLIQKIVGEKETQNCSSLLLSLELHGGGRHFVLVREGKQHTHCASDNTLSMDVVNWLAIDLAKVCLKRIVPIHTVNNVLLRCKTTGLAQNDLDMLCVMFMIDSILMKKTHQIVRKLQSNTKSKLTKFANMQKS